MNRFDPDAPSAFDPKYEAAFAVRIDQLHKLKADAANHAVTVLDPGTRGEHHMAVLLRAVHPSQIIDLAQVVHGTTKPDLRVNIRKIPGAPT